MRATFDETIVFHKAFETNCPEEKLDDLFDEYMADGGEDGGAEGFAEYVADEGYEVSSFDDGRYNFNTSDLEFVDYYEPKKKD